jgi:glycosyltransferase involved in cell wall biosynthesis
MVSVLIPIYNYDVRAFVKQLVLQFEKNGIDGEIQCLDDGSKEEFKILNREISNLKFVQYKELNVNIGRSRIRNLLATTAKNQWLLFVDCDSEISNPAFLKNYLDNAKDQNCVIYGGTNYQHLTPSNELYLHWKYGNERECISHDKRAKNKFGTFKTNNFFVNRKVIETTQFNEKIKGYGHEDTLFAKDLERNGFDIIHINNPLQHNGLETNEVFLEKQHIAIKNLAVLYKQGLVGNEIRLIKFYHKIRSLKLLLLIKKLYLRDSDLLKTNLLSAKPKLSNLDRLKLGWFLNELPVGQVEKNNF